MMFDVVPTGMICVDFIMIVHVTNRFSPHSLDRGGSRGRVQGMRTPPLRSNTTGIVQKNIWFIGVSYAIS